LDFDVVVVGSGAGGGIVAAELAQAGHRVLVAEKAQYTPPSKLSFGMLDSSARFYERSGALLTEDGSMQVYAGRAWGGGTYINWSASLRPPMKVREEWAKDYGLNYFVTKEYEEALDTVCNKAGVTLDGVKHNIPNSLLMEGCKKLGYHCDPVPQNTGGADHRCGFCTFGCPWGEKLGTHQTWLHDAADAGAQFLEGAYVSKVLIDAKRKSVRGVRILVGGGAHGNPPSEASAEHRITVTAHTVVASCGSINTPALLLRSGLRNRNIGRNLRLHPVSTVNGYFAGKLTKPYEGPILSTVSNVVADAAGGAKGGPPKGYGAKLEIAVSHPGFYTQFIPYRDPVDFRKVLLQYPRSVTVISLARDYDSIGRVWIDATGQARVDFTLGPKDAVSVTEGLIAGGKALAAAGATEVNTAQVYVPASTRASAIARWERAVRAESVRPLRTQLLCAHQMGSCRMAATPAKGAVKPDGETYEVKGLYVADASLLPTASGVNPMVTTFSMAYSVAQFMKKKLASRAAAGAQQARL
ncbi:GMC oxidoreductase-domain-containing protein, partial [Zopfochytrium polystomum]